MEGWKGESFRPTATGDQLSEGEEDCLVVEAADVLLWWMIEELIVILNIDDLMTWWLDIKDDPNFKKKSTY